jgi:hypothetical protein
LPYQGPDTASSSAWSIGFGLAGCSLKQETQRLLLEKESAERELRRLKAKEQSLRRQLAEKGSQEEPPPPPKKKIGRNDPCPCGSGKKFKKCCIKKQGSDLID